MVAMRAPFDALKPKLRAIFGLWVRFMALAVGFVILFGAWPPVGVAALLLTFCLPVLSLVLSGRSLDEELGWGERDEGPF